MENSNVVPLYNPNSNPIAIIDRAEFTRAITILNRLAEKQFPLDHIRLSSTSGGLIMSIFDGDTQASMMVEGQVDGRFSAIVPVDALFRFNRIAPKTETVRLERDGDTDVLMQFGPADYTLTHNSDAEYPVPLTAGDAKLSRFAIAPSTLWNALDATIGAVSSEETRRYLNGVFVHAIDDHIHFVATDGHRLYRQATNRKVKNAATGIIPTKLVKFLHAVLGGNHWNIEVGVAYHESFIALSYGPINIMSKMIDGTFPDYQRMFPADSSISFTTSARSLITAVKAMSDSPTVTLDLKADGFRITGGPASMKIDGNLDGDDIRIRFNTTYLINALTNASPDGKDVTLKFNSSGDPTRINGSLNGFTAILMPMRT